MAADGWWSGDLDVRRSTRDIELAMQADDLHVAEVVTWRNGKNSWGNRLPKETGRPLRRQSLLQSDGGRRRRGRARNCCC